MQNFTTNPSLVIPRDHVAIAPGQVRITANEYEELVQISAAWDRARTILDQAEKDAAAVREQARQEGLDLGKLDAQKEALNQVAQMQNQVSDWVKNTDSQLIELVNRCVGDVVNTIDPSLLVTQSVEKGLAELSSAQSMIVRVHPDCGDINALVDDVVKQNGITGQVRIVQDGSLALGDVVVESPVGVVDLRKDKQLAQIRRALKA
jgi:flagellar biosynthesis/type III secretory pathway protein FliH